jgi:hypothetical protein
LGYGFFERWGWCGECSLKGVDHDKSMRVKVANSKIHGRGVFTKTECRTGVVLDEGYVLPFNDEEGGDGSIVDRYAFRYGKEQGCLVLGVVSLCNHSKKPNAEIEIDEESGTYKLRSLRKLNKGEEIFVDYGRPYWEQLGIRPD